VVTIVTAERERCSFPRSGNGPFGTGSPERNRSHSVKIASKASFPFPDRRSSIHRSRNSGDYGGDCNCLHEGMKHWVEVQVKKQQTTTVNL
jgi:hypothetical protein